MKKNVIIIIYYFCHLYLGEVFFLNFNKMALIYMDFYKHIFVYFIKKE